MSGGRRAILRRAGLPRSRGARARIAALVASLVASSALFAACTPAEFQAWWVDHGNAPLSEPQLSEAAAGATHFWEEVARRNRFAFTVSPINGSLAARMTPSSWRPGCPVPLSELRYLRLSYMDLGGVERIGEIVVNADSVDVTVALFEALWDDRFPVASLRLIDDFGGNDDASMAADNSSAFNCRTVGGTGSWSEHAFGRAIDLNPVQNPYVTRSGVEPTAGGAYMDRTDVRPGMLVPGSAPLNVVDWVGWGWGGRWSSSKDYQHVSASGR